MDIYTLDRGFIKQDPIDMFTSAIWTERYYGDGDFEISLPAHSDIVSKLPKGQLLGCEESDQPMILETRDIKDDILKIEGITLPKWLNNRIIRVNGVDQALKEWYLTGKKPGEALVEIVKQMCMPIGPTALLANGNSGVDPDVALLLQIPGLVEGVVDTSGVVVDFAVPFGGVYDALSQIATTYEIGMKIVLDFSNDSEYQISFNTYKGLDRTSGQSDNAVIRFSPKMESFTNIQDFESITDHRNIIYSYATDAPPLLVTDPGFAASVPTDGSVTGFDLKAAQIFLDGLSDTTIPDLTEVTLLNILDQKARDELSNRKVAKLVDGEVVQTGQINYGVDYFLGDIVEVEGNTGILQNARITEYIRSQDKSGERSYPTLSMIDD